MNKKRDVECFVCGKITIMQKNATKERGKKAKKQANLTQKNFVMVVTKVNLVSSGRDWWVDMGCSHL